MLRHLLIPLAFVCCPASAQASIEWKPLAPGVDYRTMPFGSARTHVVRIMPGKARMAFALCSKEGGDPLTAGEWASRKGFTAVINAGMYATDFRTHVGQLVDGGHRNSGRFNKYLSMLVFDPKEQGLPWAQMLDMDEAGAKETVSNYRSVVQNLRLIKSPGQGVWKSGPRAWSEAAVAQDTMGRLLFLFTRAGLEMSEWNRLLLASDLQVVRAMHMEGGPEASLSIRANDLTLDLCGSYETGFLPSDANLQQRPIPNVLGVVVP